MRISFRLWLVLWLGLILYSLTSYLILLRDAFLLERIALTLNQPGFETIGLNLAKQLHVNPVSIFGLSLSILISFAAYFFLLKQKKSLHTKVFFRLTAILIATVFISFPSLSTDVFDYNNTNRLAFLHNANPWIYSADTFPEDSEIYFGSWIDRSSVYPPVAFVASALVNLFFGNQPLLAAIGFKLLALTMYAITLYLLYYFLPKKKRMTGLMLFGWNPLILIEFIGNGHNDLLLGTSALGAFIYFSQKKAVGTGLSMAFGFLAKFSIVLYFPFLFIVWFKQKKYTLTFKLLTSFALVSLLAFALMGKSSWYLFANFQDQLTLFQRSLPTIIRDLLVVFGGMSSEHASSLPKLFINPILALIGIGLIVTTHKKNYVQRAILFMLIYLILAAPMLQPWYLSWFLPLLPLIAWSKTKTAGLLFSLTALMSYPVYYVSLYASPTHYAWQIVLYLVMISLPLIILCLPQKWYTRVIKPYLN